jgi:hypothetical protein
MRFGIFGKDGRVRLVIVERNVDRRSGHAIPPTCGYEVQNLRFVKFGGLGWVA